MNIVFMGTPDFAVPVLESLLDGGYRVAAVVTQPDRPKGRRREMTPPPVKEAALKRGLPVLQPVKLRDPAALEHIKAYSPDLIVTAAYGQILPKSLLDFPPLGCVNVHASLLPKYRGGAPIHRSIINGETVTGVTIMYMAEGLDTGDMISRVEVPIEPEDNVGALHDKLSLAGAKLLMETIPGIEAGTVRAVPQNHGEATLAPNLSREDERIDWSQPSWAVYNRIRGLNPWPVSYTSWRGEVLKVWAAECPARPGASARDAGVRPDSGAYAPGTIVRIDAESVHVRTGDGSIALTEVQPSGKRRMPAADWIRGASLKQGEILG